MNELDWAESDLGNSRTEGKVNPPTTRSHPGSSESVTKGRKPAHNTLLYRIQTWQTAIRLTAYTVNVWTPWSARSRHYFVPTFRKGVLPREQRSDHVCTWYSWQLLLHVNAYLSRTVRSRLVSVTIKIAVFLQYSCSLLAIWLKQVKDHLQKLYEVLQRLSYS